MKFDITVGPEPKILLDGLDITNHVMEDGFDIDVVNPRYPVVSMRLVPNEVTIHGADVVMRLEANSSPDHQES